MADPEDEFLQWEKNITVIDAKGNSLPLVQDPNEQDAASAEGYFYYDPLPNVNVKGQSDFKIVAVDWRGVTNSSASIPFVVEANLPEVTNDPTFLRPEMSDELLSEVEHNITAEDEFENIFGDLTINLKRVLDLDRSEVTLPDNPRLSDLRDQIYIFEYNVSDFRGESILVERELRVNVTPPEINLPVFLSGYVSNDLDFSDVSEPQQLEFSDPLNEWESWIKSIYSLDYFENNITSEIEVSYADATFKLGTDEISFPPVEGEHIYSFKIIDPRFTELALLHPDQWEASMTTTAIQTITLIKTLPKFSYQDKSDEKNLKFKKYF